MDVELRYVTYLLTYYTCCILLQLAVSVSDSISTAAMYTVSQQ